MATKKPSTDKTEDETKTSAPLPADAKTEDETATGAGKSGQANQATDGGRNESYEGLFEGETEQQREERLAKAGSGATTNQPRELTDAEKSAQKENARAQQDDAKMRETATSNAEEAIAPAIEGVEDQPEVKARVQRAMAISGASYEPKPTMVNGRSVAGKSYDAEKDEWVDDPAAAATVRASDIFDRIGEAFPHERQRMVIEELARYAGMTDDSTDLPEGQPTGAKSTASLRTDVSGFGRFTGGGPGVTPVDPGKDGKAQVG